MNLNIDDLCPNIIDQELINACKKANKEHEYHKKQIQTTKKNYMPNLKKEKKKTQKN